MNSIIKYKNDDDYINTLYEYTKKTKVDSAERLFLFGLLKCIFQELDLGNVDTVYKTALSLDFE